MGLKKEEDLISEANSQLTRSQTRQNADIRSIRSNDRYSRTANRAHRISSQKDNRKVGVAKSISVKSNGVKSISDMLSQTYKERALGEEMQENLYGETGKLGMQFVVHDRLVDEQNL